MRQARAMIIFKDLKTKRTVRNGKWIPNDPGTIGYERFAPVSEILTYEVALDMHAISVLATKAGGNRTGRAKSGPVTVVITKREPVLETAETLRDAARERDAQTLYNEGRRILAELDARKEPKQ